MISMNFRESKINGYAKMIWANGDSHHIFYDRLRVGGMERRELSTIIVSFASKYTMRSYTSGPASFKTWNGYSALGHMCNLHDHEHYLTTGKPKAMGHNPFPEESGQC